MSSLGTSEGSCKYQSSSATTVEVSRTNRRCVSFLTLPGPILKQNYTMAGRPRGRTQIVPPQDVLDKI